MPSPQRPALRRALVAAALVVLVLLGLAGPAGADPAKPTNYRSHVTSVTPGSSIISVKVVGGDGFLDVTVDGGHEVIVTGYDGEPYLRFSKDGTVEENQNSPATYLNRNRFATTPVPAALQGKHLPPPTWQKVGSGGHYAWHDHRIHFMGKNPSEVPGLAQGRPIIWAGGVAMTVDGKKVVVHGEYRLLKAPSPLPWIAIAIVGTVLIVLVGRRRPVLVASIALLLGGLAALWVGVEQNRAIPPGAGATALTVILPIVAVVAAGIAIARWSTPAGVIAALASAATTGGWVLTRYSVLTKAVLPTVLSANADRIGTSVALAAAIGGAILTVRSGGLSLPRLEDVDAHPDATDADPGPAATASPPA
ncbi:MAG: hypothetical protein JOY78_10255 [Pseudonocardia sp.]|nr:hypothetical protein [Pseudonocardia sp.]